MELKWLRDYLALVEYGSFSKAAVSRHVTQPAFSRRIRSLEAWLGVSLVERNQYPLVLTPAGTSFAERAKHLNDSILLCREQLRSLQTQHNEISFSSQQALAVAFFPQWIEQYQSVISDTMLSMNTVDLHEAVETFLGGSSDFLLCYDSDTIFKQLQTDDVESLNVGQDELIPVCLASLSGDALFNCEPNQPLIMLNHTTESFFGKLLTTRCFEKLPANIPINYRYQSSLSEALKALVLNGKGIAYLPRSIVQQELDSKTLVQITNILEPIPLKITLYRLKNSQSIKAQSLWNAMINSEKNQTSLDHLANISYNAK